MEKLALGLVYSPISQTNYCGFLITVVIFISYAKADETESNYIKLVGAKPFKPVNLTPSKLPATAIKPTNTLTKITEGINELAKSSLKEEDGELDKEFWIFASQIADRVFLIIFSIVLVCSISSILSEIPDHYSFP